MKTKLIKLQRVVYGALAAALTITIGFPVLAGAYTGAQVQSRLIEMGTGVPGATTHYTVTFTPQTTEATGSIIIDFCSNSPLPGDVCTATGGTDTPSVTGVARSSGAAGTVSAVNDTTTSSKHTIKIDSTALTNGTPYTIDLSGIVNPSDVGTFYARIFTYGQPTSSNSADDYVPAGNTTAPTEGAPVDYGGVALSTTESINITAKVMEQLTFCTSSTKVSTLGGANDCTAVSYPTDAPNLTLGHGSPTKAIDSTKIDTGSVYTQLSTNASHGAIVRMVAGNTCTNLSGSPNVQAGLSSNGGSTCAIEGLDSSAGAANMTTGSPSGNPGGAFGLCVHPGSGNSSGDGHYGGANCSTTEGDNGGAGFATAGLSTVTFGMDAAVNSTYGSDIFSTTGPVSKEDDTLNFAATATLTTPAGIYTGSESLVATGTF